MRRLLSLPQVMFNILFGNYVIITEHNGKVKVRGCLPQSKAKYVVKSLTEQLNSIA